MKVTVLLTDEYAPTRIIAEFDNDLSAPLALKQRHQSVVLKHPKFGSESESEMDTGNDEGVDEVQMTWKQMRQMITMMLPIFKLYGYDDIL